MFIREIRAPPPYTASGMSSALHSSASGFCTTCGTVHSLGEGNSRQYALELMEQLERHECLDFEAAVATRHPSLATNYLWGDARGQMFGVMECEDRDGNPVILKAFSCQYDGEWLIDGWVPPLLDPKQFYDLIAEPDKQINIRTRTLQGMEKFNPDYRALSDERKALSQQLMKDIHALYHLTNFHGETRALADLLPGNIPMGVGECCAPKLLNYAALNGLKPLGLSEFYWGKENKSGTRQHKQFYPACVEKCQPILGFMLCGINSRLITNHTNVHESELPPDLREFANIRDPENGTLNVLFEDGDLVVVSKPSGLLAVPGKGEENQDCVTARIKQMFPGCIDQPEVHRLDMDTSGLMVLALNKEAHRELSRQFHDRETKKRYIALLDGKLAEESGTIELPFRLDVENRPMQIYDPIHGKTGITHWKVLSIENGKTRVEFFPITGRTHQLRVHSASKHGFGLPILGDRLYGSGTAPGQLKLHASYLSFTHPTLGKKMSFRSEPPF